MISDADSSLIASPFYNIPVTLRIQNSLLPCFSSHDKTRLKFMSRSTTSTGVVQESFMAIRFDLNDSGTCYFLVSFSATWPLMIMPQAPKRLDISITALWKKSSVSFVWHEVPSTFLKKKLIGGWATLLKNNSSIWIIPRICGVTFFWTSDNLRHRRLNKIESIQQPQRYV